MTQLKIIKQNLKLNLKFKKLNIKLTKESIIIMSINGLLNFYIFD